MIIFKAHVYRTQNDSQDLGLVRGFSASTKKLYYKKKRRKENVYVKKYLISYLFL